MQQPAGQHFPNYQGSVMYPYPPPVSSIFQYASLTSLMYGLYSGRNEDASVNIKPMLLQ